MTYDSGATTNNPIIYADGASKGITEDLTPAGTASSGTNAVMRIGGVGTSTYPIDGKISDVRVYNRILTAGEILSIASTRCMSDNDRGLVFHAPFIGAAGLTAFDGVALAAGNTVRDRIGGAIGTPAGSPVGYAETYLSVCP